MQCSPTSHKKRCKFVIDAPLLSQQASKHDNNSQAHPCLDVPKCMPNLGSDKAESSSANGRSHAAFL